MTHDSNPFALATPLPYQRSSSERPSRPSGPDASSREPEEAHGSAPDPAEARGSTPPARDEGARRALPRQPGGPSTPHARDEGNRLSRLSELSVGSTFVRELRKWSLALLHPHVVLGVVLLAWVAVFSSETMNGWQAVLGLAAAALAVSVLALAALSTPLLRLYLRLRLLFRRGRQGR